MRKARWVSLLALVWVIVCQSWWTTTAKSGGERYFPQTGHRVTGDFYDTYIKAKNPELIYGYPITDAFQNSITNRMVQYFQRAYFERRPDNPPELRVQIKLLGELLYTPGVPENITWNSSACRYFPETNHQVCYAFLDFFNTNGGIAQFGYPISETEIQDGRMVQFFQRAGFEWHPELKDGNKVKLIDLGTRWFIIQKEDPERLLPDTDVYINQIILSLNVRAFPYNATIAPHGGQSIYAIVQDQNLQPVANAQVELYLLHPSGIETRIVMPLTNEHGITKVDIRVDEESQGLVEIQVTARYDGLEGKTRTSFRIWW